MPRYSKPLGKALRDMRAGEKVKEYWAKRRSENARSMGAVGLGQPVVAPHFGEHPDRPKVPADVMVQRDRYALIEHPTITGRLLGDPLPGRSALEQKLAAQKVIKIDRGPKISAIVERT